MLRRSLFIVFGLLGVTSLVACQPIPVITATPSPALVTAALSVTLPPTGTAPSTQAPTPSATSFDLSCLQANGSLSEHTLPSQLLPQRMDYFIYLPPCYDQMPEARYPVLYMIHGQSFRHDQWINLGLTAQADAWIASGQINPLIIVMPRDAVWTPPSQDMFGQAVLTELVPFIDETYRTKAEREFRAVGGLSRGAAWAVHLALLDPEVFGAVGGHSLPVFWEDAPKIPRVFQETRPGDLPRIYIDIGDRDRAEIMDSTLWFINLLVQYDIPHEWHLFVGYHDEAYWSQHVPDYLRFYTAEW
jgi:enterochelin esterase-like enzyme